MSVRTKISVRLTPEGVAIVGSAWAVLDLEPGFSPRVSKDVNALSDLNKLITDGILPFSVPFSTTNDAAFLTFSSPIITDNYTTDIEARIVVDSRELPFDRLWIREKNEVSKRWEIEFRRSPNHWLELASKKKLCSIDMGEVTLSETDVTDGWAEQFYVDGEAVHRWAVVDYGGWVDLAEPVQFTDPPVKGVWLEDLRPLISKVFLLKQGFCEMGWTLTGAILESDWALAQFDYVLSREYYTQSKGGNHKFIGALLTNDFITNALIGSIIPLDTVLYDPGTMALPAGPLYYGGIENTMPFKGRWKFCFQGFVENTGSGDAVLPFAIFEFDATVGFVTGSVLFENPAAITVQAGQTEYANFCAEIDLEPGQMAVFYTGFNQTSSPVKLKKGFKIIIEPANKSLVRGDVVGLNKMVDCNHFFLDYFKGFVHEINGRVKTDWINRTVEVHPYRTTDVAGDSVAGFIRDGDEPIDISRQIVCDSIQMSRIKNNLTRYTRLQFAESKDAYIESLDLEEPPLSRLVQNGIELEDKVTDLINPFFEPTLEGRPTRLEYAKNIGNQKTKPMPYFPRMWDNMDGNRSFVIGPRTLFFFGLTSQLDTETGLECAFFFEGGTATAEFGYASQLRTLPFDTAPTLDASIVYGTGDRDLYVTFYLGFLQRQKRGVYMDALVMMSANDYNSWDFRTPFFFFYNGRPVRALAESIRDFAHALEVPTPIKFLVEPADTQCCDLPCSCRFTECDYYQDFGQYITQDTLDALSITSFKVNNIEQLDGPIDFGIMSIAEVGGRQYVMNLVDALSSIGIDYFTFKPSTKVYADKPDGRYFKIKRPACWGFEIIISDGEAEVYRYRDFDMAQQWFDATWEPMGYGSNPVSEPADCVTTIEY